MTEKPLAFLSLVKLLETAVGHRTGYTILDPFPCATLQAGAPAIIAIQNAGRIIAKHIGLGDLTFIISVIKQDKGTAGHIELNREGNDVFVELARDICDYKDAVLATICHELCHKYLHVHGIRNGVDQIEQEYLTDVTAVYLGFGKIMLNGSECQRSETRTEGGRTVSTTHTLKTGYISRECFAFVYRLVCAMRDIPPDKYLSGLSGAAKDSVSKCEQNYANWFKPEYRNLEEVTRTANHLGEGVMTCQDDAAARHRIIRRYEESIRAIEVKLCESHKPLREAQRKIAELADSQPNPHLRFLMCLETRESVADYTFASQAQIGDLQPRLRYLESIASSVCQDAPDPSTEILECPLDGTKLRVPSGRTRLLVTCPSCKYKFVANTASDAELQTKNANLKQEGRLLKSLKSVFGRSH